MPRNPGADARRPARIHAGGDTVRRPDGKCHRKQTASASQEPRVRVKRWGKSPPLQAQARRHGKPHRVQGQIGDRGAARSSVPLGGTGSGYRLLRQMILSARRVRGRQNSAYSPSKIIFIVTQASRQCALDRHRCPTRDYFARSCLLPFVPPGHWHGYLLALTTAQILTRQRPGKIIRTGGTPAPLAASLVYAPMRGIMAFILPGTYFLRC